jgi:hypothetical protein
MGRSGDRHRWRDLGRTAVLISVELGRVPARRRPIRNDTKLAD